MEIVQRWVWEAWKKPEIRRMGSGKTKYEHMCEFLAESLDFEGEIRYNTNMVCIEAGF